ncbi:unnamed protein product [Parnassius apollo]|uniref:(apollo) hypothetical protein n=1 Tax=Parnassius apollo TaxID=110799 RepID=A0A8S3YBW2_PARAO|nr:unnamed protein product [Parnassius apollo]
MGRSGRLLPRGCCAGAPPETEVTGAFARSSVEKSRALEITRKRLSLNELFAKGGTFSRLVYNRNYLIVMFEKNSAANFPESERGERFSLHLCMDSRL